MSEEVTINIKGPSELKLSVTISLDKSVKDLKALIAEKSNVEAERQRLIYSGRVLKDDDQLSTYKIQSNHTIHMVKGVTPAQPSTSQPQRLPTMQAGQNPSDPLTMLNTPMAHGALAGFNPFADMGLNTNDPNMFQGLMDSPQFVEQMSAMMSRPEFLDQMIAMDPRLRDNPEMRQLFQSPQFRAMMSNPEMLRSMMNMGQAMRGGGGGGGGAIPPLAGLGGMGGLGGAFGGFPPMGMSAPPPAAASGSTSASGAPAPGSPAVPTPGAGGGNPYGMIDPNMLMQLMGGMGSPPAFGGGQSHQAAPGPPPEERYATQLQQLADMGFTNPTQNVRALLASGGNVQAAIDYIFSNPGH